MNIRTNNKPRHILFGFELSDKEKQDFDYLGDGLDDAQFFRYKGQVYDLGEFVRIETTRTNGFTTVVEENSPLVAWHGISSDSYFSGVVVKYTNNYESVIVGQYFS